MPTLLSEPTDVNLDPGILFNVTDAQFFVDSDTGDLKIEHKYIFHGKLSQQMGDLIPLGPDSQLPDISTWTRSNTNEIQELRKLCPHLPRFDDPFTWSEIWEDVFGPFANEFDADEICRDVEEKIEAAPRKSFPKPVRQKDGSTILVEKTNGNNPDEKPITIANFFETADGVEPFPMERIIGDVTKLTDGWPRLSGTTERAPLFVSTTKGIWQISTVDDFFGYLGTLCLSPPAFSRTAGTHSKAEVFWSGKARPTSTTRSRSTRTNH